METLRNSELSSLTQNCMETMAIEAHAISSAINRVAPQVAEASLLIHRREGKVCFVGIGKSGHIARKLSATFASTGTPSIFVHAAEAAHGDLGMIEDEDVVVLVSNSGETPEILTLLPVLRRRALTLIGLIGKSDSTIGRQSKITIDVSVEREACPLDLAPTSSAILALSAGDALALNLLKLRGFSKDDFALSHPGGALGRRLLVRVQDIMRKNSEIPLVPQNANLSEAILEMTKKGLGITGVVNMQGDLIGVFSDGDLRRALESKLDFSATSIGSRMTQNPRWIAPGELAAASVKVMQENSISCLFVLDASKPVGVLHIHDLLRHKIV